jgi:hypothetical protein
MEAMTITRTLIAGHVAKAFCESGTPVSKNALLSFAIASHASPPVIEILQTLPEQRTFSNLRELWPHMPKVPVA